MRRTQLCTLTLVGCFLGPLSACQLPVTASFGSDTGGSGGHGVGGTGSAGTGGAAPAGSGETTSCAYDLCLSLAAALESNPTCSRELVIPECSGIGVGNCEGLSTVRHPIGPNGEHTDCYYRSGRLVGMASLTDHGTWVAGLTPRDIYDCEVPDPVPTTCPVTGGGGGGGSSAGTGGVAGSSAGGIGGVTGGAGGTPALTPAQLTVLEGGYVRSCGWQGYAWAASSGEGTTLSPVDFSTLSAGEPLCIRGSVAPDPDFNSFAILGWNLHQAPPADGQEQPNVDMAPTGVGLWVNIENAGESRLRVFIQSSAGASDPAQRWCADVAGGATMIPWSDFNTECWSMLGQPYRLEPINVAMVLVPNEPYSPVPYSFCVHGLGEAGVECGSGGSGGVGGTGGASGGVTPPLQVLDEGYVIAEPWHGYAFTAADPNSTISPASFAQHPANAPLCVEGSVQADPDYQNYALLGVNLNQEQDAPEPIGSFSPVSLSSNMIMVSVVDPRGESLPDLRVQIQSSDSRWWCASLPSSGALADAMLYWSDFNSECWAMSGQPYAGEPIQSLQIVVPGQSMSDVPYSFCLSTLGPTVWLE